MKAKLYQEESYCLLFESTLCKIDSKIFVPTQGGGMEIFMLNFIFAICLLGFMGKCLLIGLKASWGILKLICYVLFFPVILIGMVLGGLIYLALPILVIGGLVILLASR